MKEFQIKIDYDPEMGEVFIETQSGMNAVSYDAEDNADSICESIKEYLMDYYTNDNDIRFVRIRDEE